MVIVLYEIFLFLAENNYGKRGMINCASEAGRRLKWSVTRLPRIAENRSTYFVFQRVRLIVFYGYAADVLWSTLPKLILLWAINERNGQV